MERYRLGGVWSTHVLIVIEAGVSGGELVRLGLEPYFDDDNFLFSLSIVSALLPNSVACF
jgi:hypothetical protein